MCIRDRDQDGQITANNPGTATMIVSATADGVTVSDTCTVQVVSGYTGYTFEDVEIGTLPAGFTSDSGASVQQEAADNRALYVPDSASVEYALSGSRLTVNFDAWTETETASLKVELLNGADVAATYQEDCATAARALHLEVDTAGQTLLFSMDGAYTLPIALSSAVDTLRITVTGDDGWIDNFDCSTGIAPAVLDFEDGTVGAEPTGLTNIIQATVTDANAFESKQSVVVNDASASQAGSCLLYTSRMHTADHGPSMHCGQLDLDNRTSKSCPSV